VSCRPCVVMFISCFWYSSLTAFCSKNRYCGLM